LLKYGKTRWLGIKRCVDRVLEQLDALERFFHLGMLENPSHTAERVINTLRNKFTKVYLEFLSHKLGRFASVNTLFQSEKPLLQDLRAEIESLINVFKMDIMNVTDVKGEKAMDAVNRNKLLPLNKTYIGPAAMETMQSIIEEIGAESTDVKAVFEQCHNFITETIAQMQKRFEGLEQFDFLSLLKPNNAISLEPASLVGMYKKFPYLKIVAPIEDVDREWREHVCLDGLDGSMNEGEYWHEDFSAKLPNGGPKYSNLRKVISIFFSFPFATYLQSTQFG